MRRAKVYKNGVLAGLLEEEDAGYHFSYDEAYRNAQGAKSISLTLPIENLDYRSAVLFPFFDGLIPEGWLLAIAQDRWKLNPRDRMGLLLACCQENIGDITIEEIIDLSDE